MTSIYTLPSILSFIDETRLNLLHARIVFGVFWISLCFAIFYDNIISVARKIVNKIKNEVGKTKVKKGIDIISDITTKKDNFYNSIGISGITKEKEKA